MSDAIQLPKKQFHGIWIVASAIVIRDSKRAPEINQAAAFERWQTRGVKVMHGGLGRMGANLVRRLMRDGITRSALDPVSFDLFGRSRLRSLPAEQRYCFNLPEIAEAWRAADWFMAFRSRGRCIIRGSGFEELFRVCRG
jgi:hypothetical protein